MDSLHRKITVGTFWNLVSLTFNRAATVIFTIFLARFLAPEAFGLVAMISICFQLGTTLAISGLGQAIIQAKTVDDADLSTVFYSNLALSAIAYLLLVLIAPYVADFYGNPELTRIIRVVCLVVLVNAFKLIQTAVQSREMNFRVQMQADAAGASVSGLAAVAMAYAGFGVWSLVSQILLAAVVSTLVLWYASPWRPGWVFSWHSFNRMFGFGSKLLTERVLNTLFTNSYLIVIGKMFSAELTGLFFFATRISSLVSDQLTNALQRASFPALSTLQEQHEVLKHRYRQLVQISIFVIALGMAMLGALADPLFALAFDTRWERAVPYLQVMCVTGVLYPLHAMNVNLLQVTGRADLFLKVGIIKKSINLLVLVLAIPFGVMGIVIGQLVGSSLALIPNGYYSAKLVNYGVSEQVNDAGKPIVAALISGSTVWVIIQSLSYPAWADVILGSVICLVFYVGLCFLLKADGAHIAYRRIRPIFNSMFSAKSSV
jgi:O-antigen/teichoic acid export membrane protein